MEYRTIEKPRLQIPVILTNPVVVPAPPEKLTFGDSVLLNIQLYSVIGQCNADRAAIRELETSRKFASE
ncbi:Rz1-like lysis system protein LysC [Erwinia endophytica]|uniref:Rz1-like lysis system protein LysC n=1 Tax=Erwinia endophytica TaxID=1563158 RepID=UPI003B847E24